MGGDKSNINDMSIDKCATNITTTYEVSGYGLKVSGEDDGHLETFYVHYDGSCISIEGVDHAKLLVGMLTKIITLMGYK